MFEPSGSTASPPRGNVELKARAKSLEAARSIAAALATAPAEYQTQRDTYFHVVARPLEAA
ncbi:MAG: hypothetical protein QM775_27005 [Pirellulales bacterium]